MLKSKDTELKIQCTTLQITYYNTSPRKHKINYCQWFIYPERDAEYCVIMEVFSRHRCIHVCTLYVCVHLSVDCLHSWVHALSV